MHCCNVLVTWRWGRLFGRMSWFGLTALLRGCNHSFERKSAFIVLICGHLLIAQLLKLLLRHFCLGYAAIACGALRLLFATAFARVACLLYILERKSATKTDLFRCICVLRAGVRRASHLLWWFLFSLYIGSLLWWLMNFCLQLNLLRASLIESCALMVLRWRPKSFQLDSVDLLSRFSFCSCCNLVRWSVTFTVDKRFVLVRASCYSCCSPKLSRLILNFEFISLLEV